MKADWNPLMIRVAARWRRRWMLAAAVLTAAGCSGDAPALPETGQARLRFAASVGSASVAAIVVEIQAPDLPRRLVYNLPVQGGVASAAIAVPAGSARAITVRAFDPYGAESHRGSRTLDVVAGTNPAVGITLLPVDDGPPIAATLGSFTVTVSPGSAALAVGDTLRLAAVVRDADAAPVAAAVTWASLDGARATVDRQGKVTARDTGAVRIVAVYAGAAGSAQLAVAPD